MKKWLLAIALLGSASAQVPGLDPPRSRAGDQWAVLVGVSKYAHYPQSLWLDGCDRDATALAKFLQSPRGGSFPPDHVKLLTNEQATVTAVRLAVDFLIKRAQAGDIIYFFFACHGKVDRYGAGEVAYLLLYDSNPEYLNATALPMDEVRRYVDINLRPAGQVVLITDACHAGGLGPGENDSKVPLGFMADHLQQVGERSGALNIMACRRNESAVEDPRLGGHGTFTYCLLQALNGEGGSAADGSVRAQDVLGYVMQQVPRLTDQLQHPRHSTNYTDDFVMARLDLPGPQLSLPPVPGSGSLTDAVGSPASLRVVGAPVNSELYLVQGREQRTVGRVLSEANVLVLEGIRPGQYVLVQSLGGKLVEWPLELKSGSHSFDVRAGQIQ